MNFENSIKYLTGIRAFFLFVFLFIFNESSFSQLGENLSFEKISSENIRLEPGLSQNDVNCIFQDYKGKLWFGTWDGLNKYDGYDFIVYRPNLKEPQKGISHQTINSVCEDKDRFLWIGTDNGIDKFDRLNETFLHFSAKSNQNDFLSNDTINHIIQDKNGNFWISTNHGLNKYSAKTNKFKVYYIYGDQKNYQNNIINQTFVDDKGNVWVAGNKGVFVLNIQSEVMFEPISSEKTKIFNQKTINCIVPQTPEILWFGTNKGIIIFNTRTLKSKHLVATEGQRNSLSGNFVSTICFDEPNIVWIGTQGNGVSIYDLEKEKFILENSAFIENIKRQLINTIFKDRSGIIWIGTNWQGLIKVDKNSFRFEHFTQETSPRTGLSSGLIWSIYEDEKEGLLYIGTNYGLNVLNLHTDKYIYYLHDENNPNSISDNFIRDIYVDKSGNMWLSTFNGGLNKFNRKKGTFESYKYIPGDKTSLSSNSVWKFFEDSYGVQWVGTNDGLNVFDPVKKTFKRYFQDKSNPNAISNNSIFSIYEDSHRNLWICTYNGLNVYNRKTDNFSAFKNIPGKNSINVNSVFSVFEDKSGMIWIGTMGGGLNSYNPGTGKFKSYTIENGLPSNIVYRIFEDGKGNLWLSTNHGISRFNIQTSSFINYNINDGVQGYEFNHNAGCMNKKGEIYFGGMNGFNRFNPTEIVKNQNIPPIVITSFNILDERFFMELSDGDTILLDYHDNFFSIEFASLSMSNPAKNKYKYRLKNYNDKWISTDANRRIAEYTKVSPGTYIFHVIGSNNDDVWNLKGITITIIIRPPWWQTTVFKIIIILFVLIFTLWNIRFWYKRMQKKHDYEKKVLSLEKEFSEAQQKALRYQMNPHFIFNSLNSIQHFILKQDSEAAHQYLTNFSSLMRKTLENSKYNLIRLTEELDTLKIYLELESMRFEDHFEVNIQLNPAINASSILVPPMLVQPYIENAIWHGIMPLKTRGKLDLLIDPSDDNILIYTIRDNGIGREKASEIRGKRKYHKATGMRNIEDRIDLMNKLNKTNMKVEVNDLYDENGIASGTSVRLFVSYVIG